MQRTRLNTLFNIFFGRFESFFDNTWRRISLILLSLLFGFFIGSAISTTAGQAAAFDMVIGAFLVVFTELINMIFYRQKLIININNKSQNSLYIDILNSFKIGFIYSLFVEALKLGS